MTTADLPPPEAPSRSAWSQPAARPGGDHLVPFSVTDGVVLVLWSLLGQVFVGVMVGVGLQLAGIDPAALDGPSRGAVTVVVQSLVLAGALAWLAGRGHLTWRLAGSRRPSARHLLHGAGGGVAAFLTSTTVILSGDALVGPLDQPGQALLETEMLAGPALVLTVVAACVLAPVLEETIFRGVLFQALGRRAGWVAGLLGSAAVFAVVHVEVVLPLGIGSVVYGLGLFGVGAVLALVLHRSRSLVAAIIAHAVFNGIQLTFAVTVPAGFAVTGLAS